MKKLVILLFITLGVVACNNNQDQSRTNHPSNDHIKVEVKEGFIQEYWDNGNLSLAGYYKNGKANGLMKWYNEDGALAAEGNMVDGKRNGPWKICDVNDPKACINANFEMESREGLWKGYHDNGKIQIEQKWVNDKLVESQCWDKMGKEISCDTL